jgi:hypothetical protein
MQRDVPHHHSQPRQSGADLKEKTMADDMIKISLTETNFLTRWHCHVCGGRTEKDPVLAEGEQDIGPSDDGTGREYRTVRVCDQCLKGTDGVSLDQRLETFARQLEYEAEITRAMIGRLQVPLYAEWEAAQGEMIAF